MRTFLRNLWRQIASTRVATGPWRGFSAGRYPSCWWVNAGFVWAWGLGWGQRWHWSYRVRFWCWGLKNKPWPESGGWLPSPPPPGGAR